MIEKIVLDFLSARLPVPVWMEEPPGPPNAIGTAFGEPGGNMPGPPERFVLVEKTGGGVEEGLGRATLAVQSYGKTLWDALQLNHAVKKAMEQLDELDSVCRVELNNDYHFSDVSTKCHRYQAIFDILYYED